MSERNLRVLHLVPSVGTASGGLGPAALGLVQAQRETGLDARIWCLNAHDCSIEAAASYGLSDFVTVWPMSRPSRLGYSSSMHAELASSCSGKVDMIHQHSMWLGLSHTTAAMARKFNCPTMIAPEGCLDAYALKLSKMKKWLALRLYEQRNLHRARCLYALSEAEAESIRAFGLTNDIAVLPNGVSSDWLESRWDAAAFRRKFSIDHNMRILLYVGRLHPKKGLELLINAAASLRQLLSGWTIVIGGDGDPSYKTALMTLVQQNGLQDLVRFVGPLYNRDKEYAFASASLFVLPSYSEGAPMSVLEALAAEIPVITTHSSPWAELETRSCGWWVEATQDAIAQSLGAAVQKSPDDLRAMGKKGKDLILEKYTWRRIAEQTAQLYSYVCNGGERPEFVSGMDAARRRSVDKKAA